ncbi:MAG: hypothetical protein H0U74_23555 [Bradymonadaceae bacterium]|nr:hypothetical protein [Lujinxingiaceae bacterium]
MSARLRNAVILALTAVLASSSCTDTTLYSQDGARKQADRVTLAGRVCSEDPVEAQFPIRVILLIDQAAGPLFAGFDPGSERINSLRDFVQTATAGRENQLAVIGYSGQPRKHAPVEGNFTRNPGELHAALAQIGNPTGCAADDQCRDYRQAIGLTRSLIEGDLATMPAGLRVITQYVVIMVNAGPAQPMADGEDCCAPNDLQCIEQNAGPSPACEAQKAGEEVARLRDVISQMGGGGLKFHAIQLAAEPNLDPLPDGRRQPNDEVQQAMEAMAFAGRGEFQRFNTIGGFGYSALNLLGLRIVMHAKLLIAANMNAKPTPNGPVVDSDGDGLSDIEEEKLGLSPTNPDTDGDGITDFVEILTGLNPFAADALAACSLLAPGRDVTADGLTDCDNYALGTEPSLVDSDGDGIPDILEVLYGTDYLNPDAHLDSDSDGVSNGDEIIQHTDPRSVDTNAHLSHSYRYEIEDEGFVTELFAANLRQMTGVRVTDMSPGTTPGVGVLRFNAAAQTLSWQDANDTRAGEPVSVERGGVVELQSASYAPIQGEDGRRIFVEITLIDLPPADLVEPLRIVYRRRHCLSYTIRNIRLMPTRELDDGINPAGTNNIMLFFAQAPEGRLDIPGPFRMASIPVVYDPPDRRTPDDAIIWVSDDEFVRPRIPMPRPGLE